MAAQPDVGRFHYQLGRVQVALRDLSTQIDQLQANLEDTNFRLSQLSQQIPQPR